MADEPLLDKPARVGRENFKAGTPERLVIEAAQKAYDFYVSCLVDEEDED